MIGGSRFKLGLFAPNCSSGIAVTTVPERWAASWENNVALAQMADEDGIESMVPLARWKGYGGDSNLEAVTFAAMYLQVHRGSRSLGPSMLPELSPELSSPPQAATASRIVPARAVVNAKRRDR